MSYLLHYNKVKLNVKTKLKKAAIIKKIVVVSISAVFEASNKFLVWRGQIKLSRYIRTINSNITRSLNKKPV